MPYVHVRHNGKTSTVFALHSIVPTHAAMTDEQRTVVFGPTARSSQGRPVPHARLVGTGGQLFDDNRSDSTFELLDDLPPKLAPYLDAGRLTASATASATAMATLLTETRVTSSSDVLADMVRRLRPITVSATSTYFDTTTSS